MNFKTWKFCNVLTWRLWRHDLDRKAKKQGFFEWQQAYHTSHSISRRCSYWKFSGSRFDERSGSISCERKHLFLYTRYGAGIKTNSHNEIQQYSRSGIFDRSLFRVHLFHIQNTFHLFWRIFLYRLLLFIIKLVYKIFKEISNSLWFLHTNVELV